MNENVSQLVGILLAEGFENLAGELLVEIAQGRERPGDTTKDITTHGEAGLRQDILGREPVPDEEQLEFALDFLLERLVDPANALIEASEIAGRLTQGPATTIRFVDPATSADRLPAREPAPADRSTVEHLVNAIDRVRRDRRGIV